jgi:hypothetical protein
MPRRIKFYKYMAAAKAAKLQAAPVSNFHITWEAAPAANFVELGNSRGCQIFIVAGTLYSQLL